MLARKKMTGLALVLVGSILAGGCDRPPPPPKNEEGDRVKVLAVSASDKQELAAAIAVETAKIDYQYQLRVLEGYYDRVGNMDKLIWVRREIRNLQQAWTFRWYGLPKISPPPGQSLAKADERTLVEAVVAARGKYTDSVARLAEFYKESGQDYRYHLILNLQERFDPIRTYMYFLSAEIPPADAKPEAVIPEADALYAEALRLHKKGKGILHMAATTSYAKQRQALLKFLELVGKYPNSNKIALAAYYIAEIYKEYFNENIRAVHWYERAWQWDPNIPKPARFQCATVHDFRLKNYSRAVECYRAAIKHEQFNPSNVRYAHQRIAELTGK